jgi:ferritin
MRWIGEKSKKIAQKLAETQSQLCGKYHLNFGRNSYFDRISPSRLEREPTGGLADVNCLPLPLDQLDTKRGCSLIENAYRSISDGRHRKVNLSLSCAWMLRFDVSSPAKTGELECPRTTRINGSSTEETQMTKRESPITLNAKVRKALSDRHQDEHNAGHLYDRVAERLHHEGYAGLAQHFRLAAAEERGLHAQRVENILHAFDIDPPHPQVQEPNLDGQDSVLDLVYLAWKTEADLLRRYEETKALAGEKAELAVEAILDGILELQLAEVEESRALYRRCESAAKDGAGIMSVDAILAGPPVG